MRAIWVASTRLVAIESADDLGISSLTLRMLRAPNPSRARNLFAKLFNSLINLNVSKLYPLSSLKRFENAISSRTEIPVPEWHKRVV